MTRVHGLMVMALVLAWGWPLSEAKAQVSCGPSGVDLTVPAATTVVLNRYYESPTGTVNVAAGATSIQVGTAVGTAPDVVAGDTLLIVQMQGADLNTQSDTNPGDNYADGSGGNDRSGAINNANLIAGRYEYVRATSGVSAGSISISGDGAGGGLVNSYANRDTLDTSGTVRGGIRRYQVVVVRRYRDLTINGTVEAFAWNGRAGGIVALDVVNNLTFGAGGSIDVSGQGFRGGMYAQLADDDNLTTSIAIRTRGEGVAGQPRHMYVRRDIPAVDVDDRNDTTHRVSNSSYLYPGTEQGPGAPGTGGGPGCGTNGDCGGGGGGNGGFGGTGGRGGTNVIAVGGGAFEIGSGTGHPGVTRLVPGGGGGGGTGDNDVFRLYGGAGRPGGGMVMLRARRIAGNGAVRANGASAGISPMEGGGGGGGGGSVVVYTSQATTPTLTVDARGGNGGGNSTADDGTGGGGGGGAVFMTSTGAAVNVSGGTSPASVNGGTYTGTGGDGNVVFLGVAPDPVYNCTFNADPVITSNGGGATASINAAENQSAVTTVTATDADAGTTLTYSISGGADAARFSIVAATGVLTFAASPNFESPLDADGNNTYLVTVQVSDGSGGVDTQDITVTVTNVNEAPAITSNGAGNSAAVSVGENTTAVTTVTATDPDVPSTLTYSIAGGADAARFSIVPATGVLTFVTAPDFEAPTDAGANNIYDVTVQVSDGSLTDTQTIAVTVTNTNEAPVITSNGGGATAAVNAAENQTAVTTVTASDPENATLTYSISGGADAARFSIVPATGVLTFAAAPNFEAPVDADGNNIYLVTVQVSDGSGGLDTQAITVTVTNVNEAPTITSNGGGATAAVSIPENTTAVTTVTATDPDVPTTLAYSVSGGDDAARFSINPATGVLTFVTPPDFEAPADLNGDNVYEVTVRVDDGGPGFDTQAISVTVTGVNDPPAITSNGGGAVAAVNVNENSTAVTTVTAVDPDTGASVTYSISGGADAALFSINPASGVLTFVAAPDFEVPGDAGGNNVYDVTVTASDGVGGSDTQAIAVTVVNVNEPPRITSNGGGDTAAISIGEGNPAVTTVTAVGPEPTDVLTYSIVGGADAAHFFVDPNNGQLSFAPPPAFNPPEDADGNNVYEVTVQVSDGTLTDTQAISVTLTNVNVPPAFTSAGTFNVNEGQTTVATVTATDGDGDTITFAVGGGVDAARFAVDPMTGALTFVAAPDFEAPADANGDNVYLVDITASDGNGGTTTQSITVTVVNVGCSTNASCGGGTPICNTTNDTCVGCTSDAQCGALHCSPTGSCVPCVTNAHCAAPTPACDTSTFTCVACVDNTTCPGGTACDLTVLTCSTDTDNDGLPDTTETRIGTDPNDADTDDDGVLDGAEVTPDQDSDSDGLINALDEDSDNDGLLDGTEMGVTTPNAATNVARGRFIPDADPATTTNPTRADTDSGSVRDGSEDANRNGRIDAGETDPNNPADDVTVTDTDGDGLSDALENTIGTNPNDADTDDDGVLDGAEPNFASDTDGDGLINALDEDSDNDGLLDGTELGVDVAPAATDVSRGHFVPDADKTTTTSAVVVDTDRGSVGDGLEDTNRNGRVDSGEINPNNPADDVARTDTDGDGLPDVVETALGTDPNDADTDDDGVLDGAEPNFASDTDGDGLINALDEDSDNDGLLDGTELGVTTANAATDVSRGHFIADADPSTTTSAVNRDTDRGSVMDGAEDTNRNGRVDLGERDPNNAADDVGAVDTDGDGLTDDLERTIGTDANDADSDDDGILDGAEPNFASDTDGDGLINALDEDSDNDALFDGTERGVTTVTSATNVARGRFTPDADPSTRTSMLVRDTDRGSVGDGNEDTNLNGAVNSGERNPLDPADDLNNPDSDNDGLTDALERVIGTDPNDADSDDDGLMDGAEPNLASDTDGDGLINALDEDSDNDGLFDGTERGVTVAGNGTDITRGHFIADADPSTTTSAVRADTDAGSVRDGAEDANRNGRIDAGETDPNNPADDVTVTDTDGDGLSDALENAIGTNPNDADSDDDGVLDGAEPNFASDTDGDGRINALDEDSDNDGLFDGTELGVSTAPAATDVSQNHFVADAEPGTTTSALLADTDGGTVSDGVEDTNHNGRVDVGERDPNNAADDVVMSSSSSGASGAASSGMSGSGGSGGSSGMVSSGGSGGMSSGSSGASGGMSSGASGGMSSGGSSGGMSSGGSSGGMSSGSSGTMSSGGSSGAMSSGGSSGTMSSGGSSGTMSSGGGSSSGGASSGGMSSGGSSGVFTSSSGGVIPVDPPPPLDANGDGLVDDAEGSGGCAGCSATTGADPALVMLVLWSITQLRLRRRHGDRGVRQ